MATFEDMADRFRSMITDLNNTREEEALVMTFEALALVKRRVINSGAKADGGDFGGYSTKVVPIWQLGSQDGVTARDVQKLNDKYGYFASYRDLREIKGFKLFKNFSFTNKMWNAIIPTVSDRGENFVVIVFDAPDKFNHFKIGANTQRDGEFLALSPSEVSLIRELNRERFDNLLRKNKLK